MAGTAAAAPAGDAARLHGTGVRGEGSTWSRPRGRSAPRDGTGPGRYADFGIAEAAATCTWACAPGTPMRFICERASYAAYL